MSSSGRCWFQTGRILKVPLSDLKSRLAIAQPVRSASATADVALKDGAQPSRDVLEDVERKQITAALEQSRWIVAGPNGAAARLGLKRSTLQLRMKKLGISSRIR